VSIGPLIVVGCQAPSLELSDSTAVAIAPSEPLVAETGRSRIVDFVFFHPASESRRVVEEMNEREIKQRTSEFRDLQRENERGAEEF
jgi:hypothetical protein